jgi:hypothetical protein
MEAYPILKQNADMIADKLVNEFISRQTKADILMANFLQKFASC